MPTIVIDAVSERGNRLERDENLSNFPVNFPVSRRQLFEGSQE
jgi:hypothetical protein